MGNQVAGVALAAAAGALGTAAARGPGGSTQGPRDGVPLIAFVPAPHASPRSHSSRPAAAGATVTPPSAIAQGVTRWDLAAAAGLFGGLAALCGPRRRQALLVRRRAGAASPPAEPPVLESERGIDYSKLSGLLEAEDFKEADAETRRLLIVIAGPAAEKRGWVYYTEVPSMPAADLKTIDGLWKHFSDNKFGYTVQRKIWNQKKGNFADFAQAVSWFTAPSINRQWPDGFVYDKKDGKLGHLPLTNCIRGTSVLEELMSHPAYAPVKKEKRKKKVARSSFGGVSAAAAHLPRPALAGGAWSASSGRCATTARRAAESVAEAAPPAAPTSAAGPQLADLSEENVISDSGFVMPEVPEGAGASVFVIYDNTSKPQYLGFSKDLRNTLRTLLCRRPELCYYYRCHHLMEVDQKALVALRNAWADELGGLPQGNKDPRQKKMWEAPVDSGAMSARAYRTSALQKAKQVVQQLKDRGLKETVEWQESLIDEGKVDPVPSKLSAEDLMETAQALSSQMRQISVEVKGQQVEAEILYAAEFETNGGWWYDVEVSAQKQKSTHRIIVSRDFAEAMGAEPKDVVDKAFAVLLARKVPRKTEGMITSDVFPINYFTAVNVAVNFPEFEELFPGKKQDLDVVSSQWRFSQVHDYQQDDKRRPPVGPSVPSGPLGGSFDPAAFS